MNDSKTLVFDIEADNLVRQASIVRILCIQDLHSKEIFRFRKNDDEDTIAEGVELLKSAHRIVAHNGVMYDVPVLERLYKCKLPPCIDTILISRLIYPDFKNHPIGGNALADWGRFLGRLKKEQPKDLLERWSPEAEDYCVGDVELCRDVYLYLLPKARKFRKAVRLEHQVAPIILRQHLNGVGFDQTAGTEFRQVLEKEMASIRDQLQKAFPPKTEELKSFWWKDPNGVRWETKKEAKEAGVKPQRLSAGGRKTRQIVFNPGSRPQLAERLIEKYKWKPKAHTEHGSIILDEKVLGQLQYPEAKLMSRYLLLEKRLGYLESWFASIDKDTGRIHGSVNTNGAPTGRMSHTDPNLAQIPKVGKPFGAESRQCFIPRPGWYLVGADGSSVQLRMLAHRAARFDGGAYARIVAEGDIHKYHQEAAQIATRDDAKTFIYAFIFGAGDHKLGSIVGKNRPQRQWRQLGADLRDQFYRNIPCIKQVMSWVEFQINKRGYLLGLDGRPLPIRAAHAGLNTLLQSDEAVMMKLALTLLDAKLQELGLVPGVDYEFVLNIHDEWQIEARTEEIAHTVGKTACWAITEAGLQLNVQCPLKGEYRVGRCWKDTH